MTEPIVENEVIAPDRYAADLCYGADADFFEGHFEGVPVLAGVVQVGSAVKRLERYLGRRLVVPEIKKLKFMRVVKPGERLHLELTRKTALEWSFICAVAGVPSSSGIICLES